MSSELGEIFDGMREASRQKKRSNLESSTQILRDHGVLFESKNADIHLIVKHGGKVVDYWPSTGLWIDRKSKHERRGVFPLLRFIGVGKKKEPKP